MRGLSKGEGPDCPNWTGVGRCQHYWHQELQPEQDTAAMHEVLSCAACHQRSVAERGNLSA